jgi:protein LTV1
MQWYRYTAADIYHAGATKDKEEKGKEVEGGAAAAGDDKEEDEDEDEEKDGHAFGDDDEEFNDYGVRRVDTPRITEEDVDDARGAMIAIRKRAGLPLPEHS